MKINAASVISMCCLICAFAAASFSQEPAQAPPAASATGTTVPRLVSFSGAIKDAAGKPVNGRVPVIFSLYAEQEGGTPLWSETQIVQADAQGHYTVFLGATEPTGLPLDAFTSGAARWLAVQPDVSGAAELPRVLLVGVPYALKAADADTLGGKPASAFVTTDVQSPPSGGAAASSATSTASGSQPNSHAVTAATVGGSGTTNFISLWTSSTTLGNSALFQTGGNVGLGTSTPGAKLAVQSSNLISLQGFTSNTSGIGVRGEATSSSGSGYGVEGDSSSSAGIGVHGTAAGSSGTGMKGAATATSGSTYGVIGADASSAGVGVFGNATSKSGSTVGVEGTAGSPSGFGIVGTGGSNSADSGIGGVGGNFSGGAGNGAGGFGGIGIVSSGGSGFQGGGGAISATGGGPNGGYDGERGR